MKTWTVHLIASVTGHGPAGARVTLRPGRYTMTEVTDISYEISTQDAPSATFLLSQVSDYRNRGALLIEGMWP